MPSIYMGKTIKDRRVSIYFTDIGIFSIFFQVSIIIMNLLIGLAISNITAQFQSAGKGPSLNDVTHI